MASTNTEPSLLPDQGSVSGAAVSPGGSPAPHSGVEPVTSPMMGIPTRGQLATEVVDPSSVVSFFSAGLCLQAPDQARGAYCGHHSARAYAGLPVVKAGAFKIGRAAFR